MHGYFNSQDRTASQARALPPFEKSFANETAEQRFDHRIIALKHRLALRWRRKRHDPKTYIRIRELECFFADRYGAVLPDDDAGIDDIFVMANHLAHLDAPDQRIMAWLRRWAPWHCDDRTAALILVVTPKPLKWRADKLAHRLGLDYATRTRLGITTIGAIDCGKVKRASLRRKRAAARERARRAKTGAAPHATSEARLKPWLELGISESTYRRRKRKADSGDSNSCAPYPSDIGLVTKRCHEGAQGARSSAREEPEFVATQLCGTERFTISIPVKTQAMLAARRDILAATVPEIGVFLPRMEVARQPQESRDMSTLDGRATSGTNPHRTSPRWSSAMKQLPKFLCKECGVDVLAIGDWYMAHPQSGTMSSASDGAITSALRASKSA